MNNLTTIASLFAAVAGYLIAYLMGRERIDCYGWVIFCTTLIALP